ncbi:MAG: hypothetical protein U0869_26220 [Chloroflexota bacterium]
MAFRSLRAVAAISLATAAIAGCYNFATPSFHPGNARQLLLAIARRGVEAEALVGDSACSDHSLVENAIHLKVTAKDDPTPRDVWIYAFREKGWDTTKASVDACQADYAAAHPGSTITRLDIPVYRAFGADWSPDIIEAVKDGLEEASGVGVTQ